MVCELCQKNPCQCADKFNGVDADYEQALADETSKLSRTMEDILIDLITVHYNHDKLMSVNDFDSYCILAEETYNQENGEV
jgi:hypothetical protein|tara:strand:+ start:38 stop:280 length:243 start_codon:yes stop_codon:yes gene_type:complete